MWSFEHDVQCPVKQDFAWTFWTDVRNWILDADVESVELNGAFAGGSRGTTVSRSSGTIEWRIADVDPGRGATIEVQLPGAVGRFRWTFEPHGDGPRITQHVSIEGPHAQDFVNVMAPGLENGIPLGMDKLCRRMQEAADGKSRRSGASGARRAKTGAAPQNNQSKSRR